MKIDRHIGILAALSRHKKLTAPELAAMFEVSRRTINRDIDDICRAGIPVVTAQGQNGGISIMEGYNIDPSVLTREELQAVFIGLKTLDSVSRASKSEALARKIGAAPADAADGCMSIDLSSFYRDSLSEKIERLTQAINEKRLISFNYYYKKGEAEKLIEPYRIMFKWYDWYVLGWCTQRRDYRMYKLRRLWELRLTETGFSPRGVPEEEELIGKNMADDYFITAVYDAAVKYKLVEEGGPGSFTVLDDGRLYTKWGFTDPDEALLRFLGFGDRVCIIDPPEFREKIRVTAEEILNKYK